MRKVRVDLRGAEQAFGVETSYYGGTVKVGDKSFVVDGKTDRDDGWITPVRNELIDQFGVEFALKGWELDDIDLGIHNEMDLGSQYDVSEDGAVEEVVEQPVASPETEKLRKIREATDKVIVGLDRSLGGPVNWADLRCVEASRVLTDSGQERFEVLIEEASPDASDLRGIVAASLQDLGFEVVVRTEW